MLTAAADMFSVQYSLRVLHLADTAEAFQLDPKTLFADVLDLDQVRANQYKPSWPDLKRLFACLENACDGQPVALDFGKRLNLTSFGTLGIVIASMKNLAELLDFSAGMHKLCGLDAPAEVSVCGDQIHLRFTLKGWNLNGTVRRFVTESITTLYLELFRELLGHSFALTAARFSHPAPIYREQIGTLFQCPVAFDQVEDALLFPASFMEQPFSTYNPHIAKAGVDACQQLLKQLRNYSSLTDQVRIELINCAGRYPDLSTLAQRFCLAARTFSRHLEQEGKSYMELITEAKANHARQLLAAANTPIQDVALQLGYSDEANFRRAFKQWNGMTPAQYRQTLRQENGPI